MPPTSRASVAARASAARAPVTQGLDHGRRQDGNGRCRSESQLPGRAQQRVGQDRYEARIQSVDRGRPASSAYAMPWGTKSAATVIPAVRSRTMRRGGPPRNCSNHRERGVECVPHRQALLLSAKWEGGQYASCPGLAAAPSVVFGLSTWR